MAVFIIAEIGINHNGSVKKAIELIDMAKRAGFDAVKFQKRNPELYPERPYNSPVFGETTYREHKRRLELSRKDYIYIDEYCHNIQMPWFASCFDKESADFIAEFHPKLWKLASPCIHDHDLVAHIAKLSGRKTLIMSTGMSTLTEVDAAFQIVKREKPAGPVVMMHTCSEYPCPMENVNLRVIELYKEKYGKEKFLFLGYSSHDAGVPVSVAAVALGATFIEVHITDNRANKGSDHAASLEYEEQERLIRHIRGVSQALGFGCKGITAGEELIRAKVQQVKKCE